MNSSSSKSRDCPCYSIPWPNGTCPRPCKHRTVGQCLDVGEAPWKNAISLRLSTSSNYNYFKFLKVPLVLSQVVCPDFDSPRKSFGKPLRYYFRLVLYITYAMTWASLIISALVLLDSFCVTLTATSVTRFNLPRQTTPNEPWPSLVCNNTSFADSSQRWDLLLVLPRGSVFGIGTETKNWNYQIRKWKCKVMWVTYHNWYLRRKFHRFSFVFSFSGRPRRSR